MCNQPHTPKSFASLQPDGFDAVVVAGGDFPTHAMPLTLVEQARMLVACDSAGEELIRRGYIPTAIIGDCDSMSQEFLTAHRDIIYKVEEQDYNDLTKATRFCVERGCRRIAYVGATGKREDHTLGNISLLDFYRREMHIAALMATDHGVFLIRKK
jgi:thiamine pyrophosphokinase